MEMRQRERIATVLTRFLASGCERIGTSLDLLYLVWTRPGSRGSERVHNGKDGRLRGRREENDPQEVDNSKDQPSGARSLLGCEMGINVLVDTPRSESRGECGKDRYLSAICIGCIVRRRLENDQQDKSGQDRLDGEPKPQYANRWTAN